MSRLGVLLVLLALVGSREAQAQIDGSVSVLFDVLPDVSASDDRQAVGELRTRVFAEHSSDLGDHARLNVSGYVDGLARRGGAAGSSTAADAVVRPGDLYVELTARRFDLRVGASRLVWGRLDELQPTDVINPIDLSRFLLEGRSEARLPVGVVRGRVFLPRSSTIEAVVVPFFRRSRFDQLAEESSPFNLALVPGLERRRDEPATRWRNIQGGGRLSSTAGRVDWTLSAYSGFRAFPILSLQAVEIVESFPRFVMIGGDFETVRGAWGLRGEVAAFVRDELQSARAAAGVPGHSGEAGIGLDRRTGDYRIAGNVIWSWRGVDASDPLGQQLEGDDEVERRDVSLVMAVDRGFARQTRTLRLFGVWDPADGTLFSRAILVVSLRDNVALEGSGGVFTGESLDLIGRLTRRDFLYARLKVFF